MKKIYFNPTTKKFDQLTIEMIGGVQGIISVELNVPFTRIREEEIISGTSLANMSEDMLANCSRMAHRAYIDAMMGELTAILPKDEVITAYKLLKTEILYRHSYNIKLAALEKFKEASDELQAIKAEMEKDFE